MAQTEELDYVTYEGPVFGVFVNTPKANVIKFSIQLATNQDEKDEINPRFVGWETNRCVTLLKDYLLDCNGSTLKIKTLNNRKMSEFDKRTVYTLTNHTIIWLEGHLIFNVQ